jgi:hypothetical protein
VQPALGDPPPDLPQRKAELVQLLLRYQAELPVRSQRQCNLTVMTILTSTVTFVITVGHPPNVTEKVSHVVRGSVT